MKSVKFAVGQKKLSDRKSVVYIGNVPQLHDGPFYFTSYVTEEKTEKIDYFDTFAEAVQNVNEIADIRF